MSATWPETLPAPLVEGYGVNPATQFIRTEMETGSPRQRRRSAARMDIVTATWSFTAGQYADFRDWYDDADEGADGGSGWFAITLDYDGSGLTSVEARFIAAWEAVKDDLRWNVTGKLELRY